MKPLPSVEQVNALYDYEPLSGRFRWRKNGRPAGSKNIRGYRQLYIGRKCYMEHHVAWLLYYGYWPKQLDHVDRNPSNNRIDNLREATNSQNRANGKKHANNSSGFKGVQQAGSSWEARMGVHGKTI